MPVSPAFVLPCLTSWAVDVYVILMSQIAISHAFLLEYHPIKFLGDGGFEADGFFRHGVDEGQHFGVEAEAVDG